MMWGVASILQDLCEDLVFKNITAWETSGNNLSPPKRIVNKLCPRFCSNRGRCVNGTCKCRRGYTNDDCSVTSRGPPKLISVNSGKQCDLRTFLCKHIQVVGEGFRNGRNLKCSVAEVKKATGQSRIFPSKATYESYRGVTCETPISRDPDVAMHGYQVRVSNDGRLWSQSLPLLILDGLCMACSSRDMRCKIKVEWHLLH